VEIHGLKEDFLRANGVSQKELYEKVVAFLNKYIDRYNKQDKMVPAGYNVKFDIGFLESTFKRHGNRFMFSYMIHHPIEVLSWVAEEVSRGGMTTPNIKLGTVCASKNIEIEAHNALSDIKAARELFLKLRGERPDVRAS
jgi:DNA polymerase-3 subunit epsilon